MIQGTLEATLVFGLGPSLGFSKVWVMFSEVVKMNRRKQTLTKTKVGERVVIFKLAESILLGSSLDTAFILGPFRVDVK